LFVDGKLEGKVKPILSEADADWMREMGLNRLQGPGAFSSHDAKPAISRAEPEMTAEPAVEPAAVEGPPVGEGS